MCAAKEGCSEHNRSGSACGTSDSPFSNLLGKNLQHLTNIQLKNDARHIRIYEYDL